MRTTKRNRQLISNKILRTLIMMRILNNANKPWTKGTMLGQKTNSQLLQSIKEMSQMRDWTTLLRRATESMRRKRDRKNSPDKRNRKKNLDHVPLKRFIKSRKMSKWGLKLKSRQKLRSKLDSDKKCKANKTKDTISSQPEAWLKKCWAQNLHQ